MEHDRLLIQIKKKAYDSINTVEQRSEMTREFLGDVDVFKTQRYVDDRNLKEYFMLLPQLRILLEKKQTILDVGCGKGLALCDLQNDYNANVVGTVLKKTDQYDFPVFETSADKLPFSNNSFDVVISVHGISWEPNQIGAIKEIVRVLKPGGTAHIYLIKFSHSVALFLPDNFWDGINHEEYSEKYEFKGTIRLTNGTVQITELQFPEEECKGYYKEWQLFIRKIQIDEPVEILENTGRW